MTVTEAELFRGYAKSYPRRYVADLQPAVDHALRVLLEERIAELWRRRRWYTDHLGWIPQNRVEDRAELRLLVGLARAARRQAEDAAIAGTTWRAGDRDFHSWQARGLR